MPSFGTAKIGPLRIEHFRQLLSFAKVQIVNHGFATQKDVKNAKWAITDKEASCWGGAMGCTFNISGHFFDPKVQGAKHANPYRPGTGNYNAYRHAQYNASKGFYGFREYASYWSREGVGNFYSEDLNEVMLVLIAHELGHFVNYNAKPGSKWDGQNHDEGFLRTYRAIRKMLLEEYRGLKTIMAVAA